MLKSTLEGPGICLVSYGDNVVLKKGTKGSSLKVEPIRFALAQKGRIMDEWTNRDVEALCVMVPLAYKANWIGSHKDQITKCSPQQIMSFWNTHLEKGEFVFSEFEIDVNTDLCTLESSYKLVVFFLNEGICFSQTSYPFYFDDIDFPLPREILMYLLKFLSPRDFVNMTSTCNLFIGTRNLQFIWKYYFMMHFPAHHTDRLLETTKSNSYNNLVNGLLGDPNLTWSDRYKMINQKTLKIHFKFEVIVGVGSFAEVFRVTKKLNNQTYAIKSFWKGTLIRNPSFRNYVNTEKTVLMRCNHPNIVKLISAFQDEDFCYFTLEYAERGELLKFIETDHINNQNALNFSSQLVIALEYLHTNCGIIHRDLKPENILLDKNCRVILCDFGTSLITNPQAGKTLQKSEFVGTADYLSPELINDSCICFASDLWALGCTVYQMFHKVTPFKGMSDFLTMKNIKDRQPIQCAQISPQAIQLIRELLQYDPYQRPGALSFDHLKAHPYFQTTNWKH